MKKMLCLALVLTLLTGLTVPALAADPADARLAAVTLKVKDTLGLNTDAYDGFYGNFYEDALSPVWNLSWSGEGRSLNVSADENGRIISYYFYDTSESSDYRSGRFSPVFPKGDETSARAAAASFLSRVLDVSRESVVLEPDQSKALGSTRFQYSGHILLHGLPSPLSYSIAVRAADDTVIRFSRDSLYTKYLGGVPSAGPSAAEDAAGLLLKTTLDLRLEYVLPDSGKLAVLRYLPEPTDEYYVDAQTGKLINLAELYKNVSDSGDYGLGGSSASADEAARNSEKSLSNAEQEGISRLEGVLAKETLDAKLRQIPELGLLRYTLAAATYSLNPSSGDVSCRLQYAGEIDGGLWRRYVTVCAKTGALQSVYSSVPWYDEEKGPEAAVDADAAQKRAEGFLKAYYGEDYARLAPYTHDDEVFIRSDALSHSFRFVQKENGYCYPGNYYNVSIDATDGSVSSFHYHFDREVTFDSADGILSPEEAVDAYFGTFDVPLGYLAVPEKLDPTAPEWRPLLDRGYSYLYRLKLAYSFAQEDRVTGIDAKTGQLVRSSHTETPPLSYDDMSGHWAQAQAEKLAQYRVGWLGGSLRPSLQLTQFDLLCLLVSTSGYHYDPANSVKNSIDSVYSAAYSMGLIKASERSDGQIMTRGELVRLVLNAGGYGEVAALTGIFRCTFRDERSIPSAYYGYAALAQGLGMITGDSGGSFSCSRTATRAEAIAMLYRLMSR